jgi:vacuolar-type H+-ATPase subunit E/Vma4
MIDSTHKRSEELLNKLKDIEQECYENEQKMDKINLKEEKKVEKEEKKRKLSEYSATLQNKIKNKLNTSKSTILDANISNISNIYNNITTLGNMYISTTSNLYNVSINSNLLIVNSFL